MKVFDTKLLPHFLETLLYLGVIFVFLNVSNLNAVSSQFHHPYTMWLYMQSCKAFQIIHFLALLHRVYFSRIYWVIFIDTWLDSCLLFTLEPSMDKSCYLKQFSYWPMLQLLKVITFCCVTYLETLRRLIGYHATKILNSLELFTSLTSLPSIQSDLFFSPH